MTTSVVGGKWRQAARGISRLRARAQQLCSGELAHELRASEDEAGVNLHEVGAGVDHGLGIVRGGDAAYADDGEVGG